MTNMMHSLALAAVLSMQQCLASSVIGHSGETMPLNHHVLDLESQAGRVNLTEESPQLFLSVDEAVQHHQRNLQFMYEANNSQRCKTCIDGSFFFC